MCLEECNHQLYVTLNSFCQNTVNQAGKTLSAVDSELVRSQVSMQSAITALRHLNNDSLGIQDQLRFITSSNFIANIKTNWNIYNYFIMKFLIIKNYIIIIESFNPIV